MLKSFLSPFQKIGLFFVIYSQSCETIHFADCDTSQYNTSLNIKLSEKGLQNYANYNMNYAINKFVLNQGNANASFKLSSFLFQFNNIRLTDAEAQTDGVKIQYSNDQSNNAQGYANVQNIYLSFEYSVQQQIYPYLQDSGSGSIIIDSLQFQFQAKLFIQQADNCTNFTHLGVDVHNDSLYTNVNNIQLNLTGEYSYIYNGVFTLLQNTIKDLLNEQILPQLLYDGITTGFQFIEETDPVTRTPSSSGITHDIVTGQDFQNISIDETFITIKFGGQMYIRDGDNIKGVPIDIQQYEQSIISNDDFQYYIHIVNFVSQLKQVKTYGNYDNDCEITKYSKTGLILQCDEAIYQVKQQMYVPQDDSNYLFYVENQIGDQVGCLQNNQIVYDISLCDSHIEDIQQMKEDYENTVLCYFNSYGMDYCNLMYAEDNNMLVTCNIKNE